LWTVAADSGELATALIPAVWTFLGVVVVTLGTIFVQSIKSRSERTSTPPASNGNGNGTALIEIARDQGVLTQRADDSDQRDDVQDVRLNAIERHLDTRNPEWRTR
jgi:hypothetical protein